MPQPPSGDAQILSTEQGKAWYQALTAGDPQLSFDTAMRSRPRSRTTPRWTAYEAKRFGIDMPDEVPMMTTKRGYTSPIWYDPA